MGWILPLINSNIIIMNIPDNYIKSFDEGSATTQAHHPPLLTRVHVIDFMDTLCKTQPIFHLSCNVRVHPSMSMVSLFELYYFSIHFNLIFYLFIMGLTHQRHPFLSLPSHDRVLGFEIQFQINSVLQLKPSQPTNNGGIRTFLVEL